MTSAESGFTAPTHANRRVWARAFVHLGLLLTTIGALATLTILYSRNAIHADIGLAVVGLVVIHLLQRRRTIARMMSQLAGVGSYVERRLRLAGSDLLLAVITINVLASRLLDWSRGEPLRIPPPASFQQVALSVRCRSRFLSCIPRLAPTKASSQVCNPVAHEGQIPGRLASQSYVEHNDVQQTIEEVQSAT